MHDGGKILGGLAAFIVVAAVPFWNAAIAGKNVKPEPKIVTQEKQCVASKEVMRATHMDMLNTWRNTVVREGKRTYLASSGKTVTMSLSNTCMSCHPSKKEFCDACHTYLAVSPYCWDCHVEPKEKA